MQEKLWKGTNPKISLPCSYCDVLDTLALTCQSGPDLPIWAGSYYLCLQAPSGVLLHFRCTTWTLESYHPLAQRLCWLTPKLQIHPAQMAPEFSAILDTEIQTVPFTFPTENKPWVNWSPTLGLCLPFFPSLGTVEVVGFLVRIAWVVTGFLVDPWMLSSHPSPRLGTEKGGTRPPGPRLCLTEAHCPGQPTFTFLRPTWTSTSTWAGQEGQGWEEPPAQGAQS